MEVAYHDDLIEINGSPAEVRRDVKDVLEKDGIVIVLLTQPSEGDDPRNVLAFDHNADQLWEIEPVHHKSMSSEPAPYISIQERGDQIVARSWNSYRYEVDPETGTVTEIGFVR